MTEINCLSCKYFYVPDNGENEVTRGMCYRYPPQVSVSLIPQPNKITQQVNLVRREDTAYPTVLVDGFCGEWKAKEGEL